MPITKPVSIVYFAPAAIRNHFDADSQNPTALDGLTDDELSRIGWDALGSFEDQPTLWALWEECVLQAIAIHRENAAEAIKSTGPKFPEVEVQLSGQDGNAFVIMGNVTGAMRRAGISKEDRDAYMADAMSGDYDHLLQVTMATVSTS